jgi:hypothetical protein
MIPWEFIRKNTTTQSTVAEQHQILIFGGNGFRK